MKKVLQNRFIQGIIVSLLSFCVLLALWNQPSYASDEPEIFVKGSKLPGDSCYTKGLIHSVCL